MKVFMICLPIHGAGDGVAMDMNGDCRKPRKGRRRNRRGVSQTGERRSGCLRGGAC
jgi:hypothetical protein